MVAGRITRWSLVTTLLFAVSAAIAQTGDPTSAASGGAKLRVACGGDLQRFCVGVQPGEGRLIQCLSAHMRELSEACGNMIGTAGGGARLRAACRDDLQRLCVGVQPGGGRIIQCLSAHTPEVSAACGNMIAAMHARRDIPNSSEQSSAARPAPPVVVGNPPATMGSILRASCGPDVQRHCAGARSENDVLKCLDSQRMELSTVCSLYFQKLGPQPTAQRRVPIKKPQSLPPAAPPARPPSNDNPPEQGPG